MGDRGNIVVRSSWPDDVGKKEAVFLYTHWGGSDLPEVLRQALERGQGRWGDAQYLARIVFDEMTRGEEGTTGYGISTRLADNEYDLLVLLEGRVYRLSEKAYFADGFDALDERNSISFEEYVATGPRTWENLLEVGARV